LTTGGGFPEAIRLSIPAKSRCRFLKLRMLAAVSRIRCSTSFAPGLPPDNSTARISSISLRNADLIHLSLI
jgi:hypothetical protein